MQPFAAREGSGENKLAVQSQSVKKGVFLQGARCARRKNARRRTSSHKSIVGTEEVYELIRAEFWSEGNVVGRYLVRLHSH